MNTPQKVKIHQWDLLKAQTRQVLDILHEKDVMLPEDHDKARKAAEAFACELTGGKINSCAPLVGGGFAIIVEMPER
jgi:hypothetical protein